MSGGGSPPSFPSSGSEYWIRHVGATDSTQDHLFRMCRNGDSPPPSGTVIVADRQSRGRGREGRKWLSPEGGLYLSILVTGKDLEALTGEPIPTALPRLPLTAGLAVADLIEKMGGRPEIKWPNDVLLDGRKLAGILCEAREADGTTAVAVGIGLNIREAPLETAASLAELFPGREVPTGAALLGPLLDAFADRIRRSDTPDEVDARLYGRGRMARHDGVPIVIRGVAPSGALVVERDGRRIEIASGEVVFA